MNLTLPLMHTRPAGVYTDDGVLCTDTELSTRKPEEDIDLTNGITVLVMLIRLQIIRLAGNDLEWTSLAISNLDYRS